jgi:hypothetical protein
LKYISSLLSGKACVSYEDGSVPARILQDADARGGAHGSQASEDSIPLHFSEQFAVEGRAARISRGKPFASFTTAEWGLQNRLNGLRFNDGWPRKQPRSVSEQTGGN